MELKDKRYNDIRLIFHEEEHKYNDSLGNDYISTTKTESKVEYGDGFRIERFGSHTKKIFYN